MKRHTNYLAALLAVLTATQPALAAKIGDDTVTIGRPGSSTDKTVRMGAGRVIWSQTDSKLKFSNDSGATLKDLGTGGGGAGGITLLTDTDADFEAASSSNWTASGGSFTKATSTPNLLYGARSGLFNASASGQTLSNALVTPAPGMFSGQGQAYCYFKTAATDYKLQVFDGSVVLSESVIASSTVATKQAVPSFTFPASGTVRLRVISQSDAADLAIDNCFLGQTDSVSISQASYFGGVTYPRAANCNWSFTAAATYGGFPADTDCTGIQTRGAALAPTTAIPAARFSSIPEGTYIVKVNGGLRLNNGGTGVLAWRVSNGTIHSTKASQTQGGTANEGALQEFVLHVPTALSNATFEMQAVGNTQLPEINNDSGSGDANYPDFVMDFFRFPGASQSVETFDTVAQSWSGYHDTDCSWQVNSGTYAQFNTDASCTFGSNPGATNIGTVTSEAGVRPGIVFTPNSTGKYKVCAKFPIHSTSVGFTAATALTADAGANVYDESEFTIPGADFTTTQSPCMHVVAASVAPITVSIYGRSSGPTAFNINGGSMAPLRAISWTIEKLDQQVPAPLAVNTVASSSAGIERIERAVVRGGSFGIECTTDPCTIASQSGGLTSVGRLGTGNYRLTFNAGVFSAAPTCVFSSEEWVGLPAFASDFSAAPTATGVDVVFRDATPAATDVAFNVICMGPR